jgi:hypothetical protein
MSFLQDALEPEYAKARAYALYVVNTRDAAPYCVARHAVYGLDVAEKDLDIICAKMNEVRRLYLNRLFDLARFALRMPVRGLALDERYCDQDRLRRAFILGARCQPTCVIYPPKTQKQKFHRCNCANFCHACWSNNTARQYEQYVAVIDQLLRDGSPTVTISTRVSEEFVPAPPGIDSMTYAEPEVVLAAVACIGSVIRRYKTRLAQNYSRVYRNTAATCWRLVPVPVAGGWRMQCRQLVVSTKKKPAPVVKICTATVPFEKTVTITDSGDPAVASMFYPFAMYPKELLTEDIDLTAASLNAMSKQRMLGGSGKFRRVGTGLVRGARTLAALVESINHDG